MQIQRIYRLCIIIPDNLLFSDFCFPYYVLLVFSISILIFLFSHQYIYVFLQNIVSWKLFRVDWPVSVLVINTIRELMKEREVCSFNLSLRSTLN